MRFLPVGDSALLIEVPSLEEALGLLAALTAAPIPGVVEVIPAARTVLLSFQRHEVDAAEIERAVRALELSVVQHAGSRVVEIPVEYLGEDLTEVADHLGLSEAELIALHTGVEYQVAFTGFAPGFAYLVGGDPVLDVPRRSTPRTRIPAGSVGLAGTFSGVYPRESPGGWQLIGRTDLAMWDVQRDPPALLQPGDRVQFVDVTHRARRDGAAARAARPDVDSVAGAGQAALEVLSPGAQSLLQDLGRPGMASMGVSRAGALDPLSLREANRIVGNDVHQPVLEAAYGGLSVMSRGETVVAVTGASVPITIQRRSGGRQQVTDQRPMALSDGDRLSLGAPQRGIRNYLAVRGGFVVTEILGSASSDTLSGVGPEPIASGDVLAVGPAGTGTPAVSEASPWPDDLLPGEQVVLPVVLGPRDDWFTDEAIEMFLGQEWEVTAQSNRVGLRLRGANVLSRAITEELPSEGTIAGAIQVPASGQPVIFLADHPVTGGYPVIAVLESDSLRVAGQLPVGARIRFEAREAQPACAPQRAAGTDKERDR